MKRKREESPEALRPLKKPSKEPEDAPEDLSAKVSNLKAKVASGDLDAHVALAQILECGGPGVNQDSTESQRLYTVAAEKGHPMAQFKLAMLLRKQSMDLLSSAAKAGLRNAQVSLASIYANGEPELVAVDTQKALHLLEEAATDPEITTDALWALVRMKRLSKSGDMKEVCRLLQIVADRGHTEAMYDLANLYRIGDGCSLDPEKAVELFTKAAELGHVDSQFALASIYENQYLRHGERNFEEEIKWYAKAVENGHVGAMWNLAYHYHAGIGVPVNQEEAIKIWKRAADLDDPPSIFKLAEIYWFGRGVPQDRQESVRWLERGAKLHSLECMVQLGQLHHRGDTTPVDKERGLELYRIAAEGGNLDALNFFANLLNRDDEPSLPRTTLLHYAEIAMGRGSLLAKSAIGWYLWTKATNEEEKNKGFEFLKYSADHGDVTGQVQLGQLYATDKTLGNSELALRYFRMAAEQGDPNGQFQLASMLKKGEGVEKNCTEALELFHEAAKKDHVDSIFQLGWMYNNAEGTPRDKEKAAHWYKLAADKGNLAAQNNYASLKKDGVPPNGPDYAESIKYYRMAAERNNPPSLYGLALAYEDGLGVEKDINEAIRLYKLASDKGTGKGVKDEGGEGGEGKMMKETCDVPSVARGKSVKEEKDEGFFSFSEAILGYADATYNLAVIYDNTGEKLKAVEIYEKAGSQGSGSAYYNLALTYKQGDGVPVDLSKTVQYYRLAIEKGEADSIRNLASMLLKGEGVDQNMEEAVKLLKLGIEGGDDDCMWKLAQMYERKQGGLEEDIERAKELYKMSSDRGNNAGTFGLAYLLDMNGEKEEAVKYYEIAAERGHGDAMFNLAMCHDQGEGVDQDKTKAVELYKRAMDLGVVDAKYSLGLMYYNGEGVDIDREVAFKFFTEAVNDGYASAYGMVGHCYHFGEGVEVDWEKALNFYTTSYVQGNLDANIIRPLFVTCLKYEEGLST